jgi:hypothetical protein
VAYWLPYLLVSCSADNLASGRLFGGALFLFHHSTANRSRLSYFFDFL